jgi:uncharacterized membrane protein
LILSHQPKSLITISLVSLLLCSSLFAFYHSNTAYSSDEVWSVKAASSSFGSEIAALKDQDVHPPLYFLILHLWIRLFGTGERSVRSLSGLFYILTVFAVYGIGRDLYGRDTALLSAALYLCSPLAILSAQFARMYALLGFLSILSIWLYLQFSIKRNSSKFRFALYVLVNVLGTFTHIAFFFLLFGQIAFHLMFYRREAKRFLIAIALSLVPYTILWLPVLFAQLAKAREDASLGWVKKPSFSMIAELFLVYGGAFWLLIPVLIYMWWRSGFSLSRFSKLSISSLPLWLLTISLLTPFVISFIKPVFNSRLAIIGLAPFALTIGAVIGRMANYFLLLALIVLTIIFIPVVHPASSQCDNRAVAKYLNQTTSDGDVVIFTSLTRFPIDYYLERSHSGKNLIETSFPAEIDQHPGYEGHLNDPSRGPSLEREANELVAKIDRMRLMERNGRVFFFHGAHPETDSIVETRLRERFQLVSNEGVKCVQAPPYFKELSVYAIYK